MKRYPKVFFLLIAALSLALAVYAFLPRHTPIDQWSGSLTAEKIGWAQLAREYGEKERSYMIPEPEYPQLISLLKTVMEDVSSREAVRRLEAGNRLAFFYDDQLWLFKCCEDQTVSLMFEDRETGKIYGCEGKQLYIQSPALWDYIMAFPE